jgi:hypothetical protein
MTIKCPHCGAEYPGKAEHSPDGKLRGHCTSCNSRFIIWTPGDSTPVDRPNLPAEQIVALAIIDGPDRGQVFRLSKPRTVLGRSGADIVFYDREVSRKHCVIEVSGATATLTDLGTTNGTFVDGNKIQSCQLNHLSKFRIGATTLLFTVTDKAVSESDATVVVRSRAD